MPDQRPFATPRPKERRAVLADVIEPMTRAIPGSYRVERAIELVRAADLDAVPVLARRRVIGAIDRSTLDGAMRHGLGRLAVCRLVTQRRLPRWPLRTSLHRANASLGGGVSLVLAVGGGGRVMGFATVARLHSSGVRAAADPSRLRILPGLRASLSPELRRASREARAQAVRAGVRLLLVGGSVRDALTGRPAQDLDLVVCGPLDPWLMTLAERLDASLERNPRFDTACLVFAEGQRVDVARARRESYRFPGALPEVSPATLEEDLARRDFTVNAMALEWSGSHRARLFDPWGGQGDLRRGEIRALHGLSFVEDPTRAWRAVELAARLELRLGAETVRWMDLAHETGAFAAVSGARLMHEMERTFSGAHADRAMGLSVRHGLLRAVLSDWSPDPLSRRRARVACLAPPGAIPRWMTVLVALASCLSPRARRALTARLEPSRRVIRLLNGVPTSLQRLERAYAAARRVEDAWIWLTCRSHEQEVLQICRLLARPRRLREAIDRYLTTLAAVRPDIEAADLVAAGVPVGPQLARGLERALLAKLSRRAATDAEQLAAALAPAHRRA